MLFAALVIVVVGVLLMLHGSNMLLRIDSLAIFVMGLAAILIFSGITLMVLAVVAAASV